MAFTLMPNGPSVFARDLVRATQEILRAGVLIAVPGAGLIGFVWVIAAYAIVFGVLLVGFAFRLKKLQDA